MPILGTVGSEASRNKLKELSRGLGMNETFFFCHFVPASLGARYARILIYQNWSNLIRLLWSPHLSESRLKTILNSGFHAVDFGFQLFNSGFGWRDSGFLRLNFGIQSPGFLFDKQKFPGFHRQKWKRAFRKSHAAHSVHHT